LAGVVVSQTAYVAGVGCGYSGFDGGVGFFAGFNTLEEILHAGDRAVICAGFAEDGVALAEDAFAAPVCWLPWIIIHDGCRLVRGGRGERNELERWLR
jgi:hypothetical protein